MGDEPIRYIKPHLFDWGLYKEHGGAILVFSAVAYLAAFATCVLLIRRTAERAGCPRAGLVAGLVALWPMVYWAVASLELQTTSAHYQERVHIPAVSVVGVTVGVVVVVWLISEGVRRARAARQ